MANIFIWSKISQSSDAKIIDELLKSSSVHKKPSLHDSDKSNSYIIRGENTDKVKLKRNSMIGKIISILRNYLPGVETADPIGEINSLDSQSLIGSLSSAFGTQFPATLIYDYPTAMDIVKYIEEMDTNRKDDSNENRGLLEETKEVIAKALRKIVDKNFTWSDSVLDFGLDSLEVVQFSNDLSEYFHIDISPTWMFDYPTIDKLAEAISSSRAVISFENVSTAPTVTVDAEKDVFVVSCSTTYPSDGRHTSFETAFDASNSLHNDLVACIPLNRWDIDNYYTPSLQGTHRIRTMHSI
jgi:acyl carrier protein